MVGISLTANASSSTAATVSETPSTVIEPFSTTYRDSAAGSRNRTVSHCSAGSRASIVADAVDVALHQVPAEPAAERGGPLQVDRVARGAARPARSGRSVSPITSAVNDAVGDVDHGQADAVDRDRVAVPGVGR